MTKKLLGIFRGDEDPEHIADAIMSALQGATDGEGRASNSTDPAEAVERAVKAVQLMTGLDTAEARAVVDGDHSRCDGDASGLADPEETLEAEVRAVIEDCLDQHSPAGAINVASLMEAMDAGWSSAYGESIDLRLPDDREVGTGEWRWSRVEVDQDDGSVEFLPTGVDDDCSDPLTVAEALARIAPRHPDAAARETTC